MPLVFAVKRLQRDVTISNEGNMRRSNAAVAADPERIRVQGLKEPVEVRRHHAARRMTLRVSRTQRSVIVTLPMSCDLAQAGTFLTSNIDWVRERLGSMPDSVPFTDGCVMPLRGVPHIVKFAGAQLRCQKDSGVVTVAKDAFGRPTLRILGHDEHAPRRLRDWLVQQARRDLDAQVTHHARVLKLRPTRLTVRDQTSRWGSCSSTGALSFSWRLVLAPPFILEYVAAHEVAHLAEMNHGPKFWSLVRKTMPRTDEAKAWLQVYGVDLHRYGNDA
jgi:predicted metal-dependent hydrolase